MNQKAYNKPAMSKAGFQWIDGKPIDGLFTADDELADIELGDRVTWYYLVADIERQMKHYSLVWYAPYGAKHNVERLLENVGLGHS